MGKVICINNIEELNELEMSILKNLNRSIEKLKEILEQYDAFNIFHMLKFEKTSFEALSGAEENLIETINQSQTYIVSIKAVRQLIETFPECKFVLNMGNVSVYDIESTDGTVIAECFAATSFKSNAKLVSDLKRLAENSTAKYKFEFFHDVYFNEGNKQYYNSKYPEVEIIKFSELTF